MKNIALKIVSGLFLAMVMVWLVITQLADGKPANTPGADESPVLVWHREGGIAGFCDELQVYPDNRIIITTCRQSGITEKTLATADQAMLETWLKQFGDFEKVWADPAVADAMSVSVVFKGHGKTVASPVDMQSIRDYADLIFSEYTIDTSVLLWEDAVSLLMEDQVEQVVQLHNLEVTLILYNGQELKTIEPAIDAVFAVIKRCGNACKDIIMVTE